MVGTDEDADVGIFFYLQAKCRPDFDCLWQKQDSLCQAFNSFL